jgi:hypothetical protein
MRAHLEERGGAGRADFSCTEITTLTNRMIGYLAGVAR